MKKNKTNLNSTRDLRRRAEERLKKKKAESPQPGEKDIEKLVYELEVHQIELEMQNEELRRALREVEASRNRYADLYDFAPVAYFTIDYMGKVREVNLTGAVLLGVERSFAIGKLFSQWVRPDSQDAFYMHMKKMLGPGERETCELQLQRKDGTSFYAFLDSIAIDAGDKIPRFRTAVIDITSKREHDALKASELMYRLLFEHNPAGIFRATFDPDTLKGRRIECNNAYARILGYGSREELGTEEADIIFPSTKDWKKYVLRLFKDKNIANMEVRVRRKNGKSIWVLASFVLMEERVDDLPVIEATVIDITDRKKTERKLSESNKKLRSLASELIMVEAKERQNLATALHDTVAQTLAAAKMRVESLKETIRVDGLETMEEARILLNKSIQQTRSIMAELSPPVLFEIGFIPALESLAEQITNLYGISVEVYSENDLSLARETQVLLYQSTRELLLNVAKHANAKKAEVTVSGANGVARIEVSDDGIGLDMSKVGYREDLSGGFGLFNIRERFAHFGGQLAIQSSKGEGTKVVLIIPAQGGMAALKGKIGHEH